MQKLNLQIIDSVQFEKYLLRKHSAIDTEESVEKCTKLKKKKGIYSLTAINSGANGQQKAIINISGIES